MRWSAEAKINTQRHSDNVKDSLFSQGLGQFVDKYAFHFKCNWSHFLTRESLVWSRVLGPVGRYASFVAAFLDHKAAGDIKGEEDALR